MPTLSNYNAFDGLHWETGTIRNALDYQGFKAPHTNEPFTEAMLLGISGGVAFGYFLFDYQGHDPQVNLLTRNTFHPFETTLERLGVVQTVKQTNHADRAERNLIEALEQGDVPLVWADIVQMPYSTEVYFEDTPMMMPIVVFGYDGDMAQIADRARVPLTVDAATLAQARGQVKKEKHRIITLHLPDTERLIPAVQKGIWDCISLYTDTPPPGPRYRANFGFAGMEKWIELLTNPKARKSWARDLPSGRRLYAVLTTAYHFLMQFGKDGSAERQTYAAFLDEAALLLDRPALNDAAKLFRECAVAWDVVGVALLPDDVTMLGESRRLMDQKHRTFLTQGGDAIDAMRADQQRLAELKAKSEAEFPLDEADADMLRERIAAAVSHAYDVEKQAVAALTDAVS